MDGLQAWYLVFENPHLMTEWMTILRVVVGELKEREVKLLNSAASKTSRGQSTPKQSLGECRTNKIRFPLLSSPMSTTTESLLSSPASFFGCSGKGISVKEVLSSKLTLESLNITLVQA